MEILLDFYGKSLLMLLISRKEFQVKLTAVLVVPLGENLWFGTV